MIERYPNFNIAIIDVGHQLHERGQLVDTGHWQGVPTDPSTVTIELTNVAFTVPMPVGNDSQYQNHQVYLENLQAEIKPNLPWADDHFAERVSRVPSNPGAEYQNWPWWQGGYQEAKSMTADQTASGEFKFTHTYQERFWPRWANGGVYADLGPTPNCGIRYRYGDLDDLVGLLLREPHTRQAYLPIFFPEDTGAVHGGRIPCTLGYHLMLREGKLSMWYFIRSCDFVRHFKDDLYLSARLLLWVLEECRVRGATGPMVGDSLWEQAVPGDFAFVCPSLHIHKGDLHHVRA